MRKSVYDSLDTEMPKPCRYCEQMTKHREWIGGSWEVICADHPYEVAARQRDERILKAIARGKE